MAYLLQAKMKNSLNEDGKMASFFEEVGISQE